MIFFSLCEAANKVLGVFIFALYARVLGAEDFALFSSTLIILGYFIETSFFSYQSKHLADYNKIGGNYLYSITFYNRIVVTLLFSTLAAFVFNLTQHGSGILSGTPLLFIFLFIPLTFEFVAFGEKKSNFIVVARFLSQIIALLLILLYSFKKNINTSIFTINLAQTITLTITISGLLVWSHKLSIIKLLRSFTNQKTNILDIIKEIKLQTPIFLSKIATLLVITIELPVLLIFSSKLNETFSVANRLSVILFPFIYFYLNKNFHSISQESLSRFSISSIVASIVLIIISPATNYILLGNEHLNNTFIYNFFLINIGMQTIVTCNFMLSTKENSCQKNLKPLFIPIIISALTVSTLCITGKISAATLIAAFYLKCILIVIFSPGANFLTSYKITTLLITFALVNLLLHKTGYFSFFEYALPRSYLFLEELFRTHIR